MPKFNYVAVGPDGTEVKGIEEAPTFAALNGLLHGRDLAIKEAQEKKSIMRFELTKKKVPRKDLMHFSRQMAVFLRAGIPVIDALNIIREELPKKSVLGDCLADMISSLESGTTFTGAARSHPEAFPAEVARISRAKEEIRQRAANASRYAEQHFTQALANVGDRVQHHQRTQCLRHQTEWIEYRREVEQDLKNHRSGEWSLQCGSVLYHVGILEAISSMRLSALMGGRAGLQARVTAKERMGFGPGGLSAHG